MILTPPPTEPRLFGYVRCSHAERAASGLTIEGQIEAIRKYSGAIPGQPKWHADSWGSDLPGVFVDAAQSAWKKRLYERPAGSAMRKLIKPGDHVVLYSLDRGFRSVYDFSRTMAIWGKVGISIYLVSEQFNMVSANGKLLANIFAAFAQWKSDVLSERSKAAAKRRKKGRDQSPEKSICDPCGIDLTKEDAIAELPDGRVFTYARASHEDSVLSGAGLEAQKDATTRYAEAAIGLPLAAHLEDLEVSAYKVPMRSRPRGGDLDRMLQRGDHVVISRMDRGWRNLRDMLETIDAWRNRGVTVHLADTMLSTASATGDIFLKIMAMLSEWESRFVSERTTMAMRTLKKKGCPTNQFSPIGFKKVNRSQTRHTLKLNRKDIRTIWYISHLRDNHGLSWERVSDVVEAAMASQEGREQIPRSGLYGKQFRGGVRRPTQMRLSAPVLNREWGAMRCRKAYLEWPRLKEIVSQVMTGPDHEDKQK